jgi:translation initiation factor 4A
MYETEKVIDALGQFLGVKPYTCTGGTSFRVDQQTLSSRVQVVIGTPGRILDLLSRDALCKDHIRMLVLDEADELLTGGFKDQVSYNSFTYQLCCGNQDE